MSLSNTVETVATMIIRLIELTGQPYDEVMRELDRRHKIADSPIDDAIDDMETNLPD